MKRRNILLGILLIAIAFVSCDKISDPIFQKQANSVLPNTLPTDTNSSKTPNVYKMLLEDCTGHLCDNCPQAAINAEIVLNSNIGSQVVLMEDNLGFDAVPADTEAGYPIGAFAKDYRCVAGTNWCTFFNITFFPYGMTNRMGYRANNTFVLYTNYPTVCNSIVASTSQSVAINIHDSCWIPQRLLGVEFQLTFKKALLDTIYNLETVIIEDSIKDWQMDVSVAYGADSAYWKRNTLRGSFDLKGTGIAIPLDSSNTAGGKWTSYQTYNFTMGENGKAATWNMEHCYVMAFVYNSVSQMVVQAEMIKIAPHLYP